MLTALVCLEPTLQPLADEIAVRLSLPLQSRLPAEGCVLKLDREGLGLQLLGKKAPGPVQVELAGGAVEHRRRFGGGSGQMIARAVGARPGRPLQVLDATAGLGRDAFVLATLGCRVQMLERHPVVAELLRDGLRRAAGTSDPELAVIVGRLSLLAADSLRQLGPDTGADVVYLDPMFPERSKSASVKKEMAIFHQLVGGDADADELLPLALDTARCRVVVKRPRKAPFLAGRAPSHQLTGKTSRYDVYVNARLPD